MHQQAIGDEASRRHDHLGWSRWASAGWYEATCFLARLYIRNAPDSEVALEHPHRLMDSPGEGMAPSRSKRKGETRRWLKLGKLLWWVPPCSTRREQTDPASIRAGHDAQRSKVAGTKQWEARTGKDIPLSNRGS